MKQEFKEEGPKQWFAKIIIVFIIAWIGYEYGKTDNSRLYNPRNAVNGVDTIYYIDSLYKVKIQIDTAIELEGNYDL